MNGIQNIPPLVFVFIFYIFISSQLVPAIGLDNLLRYHSGEINPNQHFLFGRLEKHSQKHKEIVNVKKEFSLINA